jgi:polyferredoxin
MNKEGKSISIANPHPPQIDTIQKIGLTAGLIGLLIMLLALLNVDFPNKPLWLGISLTLIIGGTVIYANRLYLSQPQGIKNNGVWFKSISNAGFWGWIVGVILTAFYVLLYWFPQYLGLNSDAPNTGIVSFFDPLSYLLNGHEASQWFVYGTLYTVAILALGYKFILKYRHNRYQLFRTVSVMFFQLGFAFLIPEILEKLNPNKAYFGKDLKNMWPLDYDFFFDWHLKNLLNGGNLGLFMLLFGIALIFIISPILTYFYGKRWYCSWVCGCGGLAETAGDPFRQLSSKKMYAWKFERWSIHLVLVFAFVMTIAVIYSFLGSKTGAALSIITKEQFILGTVILLTLLIVSILIFKRKAMDKDALFTMGTVGIIIIGAILINYFSNEKNILFVSSYQLREWYGFGVGAAFSGVIGVGFYPLLGSRVWCRFGCPMAAILGLQQRLFSRFRITTNGGQCISCGNCSTYCEMGIDVRAYAQKGENIVRSSCVGCGICSAVCPRGVLKLENGSHNNRINANEILLGNDVNLMELINKK